MRESRKGIPLTRLPLVSTDCFLLSEWDFEKNDKLNVHPDKITLGSGKKVYWICSTCGNSWMMRIASRNYNNRQGCNSTVCKDRKKKITNLSRYGAEHVLDSNYVKEKIKKTNLKRYGVENVFQSKKIKEKIKRTNLKKYGVCNPQQSEKIKNKTKLTNLKKYGVEYCLQNQEIKEKTIKTLLNKYGKDNLSKVDEFQQKKIETSLRKYGKTHHWKKDKKEKGDRAEYYKKYAGGFTKKLKEEIKARDNYICQSPMCSHKNTKLLVHHIDNIKHNNDKNNLITLCFSCHSKITASGTKKQEFYEQIFKEILEKCS
jgi:hypothetical protein